MEILAEISHGGFGRVERVLLEDGSAAARKVLDPAPDVLRNTDPAKLVLRFKREVTIQSSLGGEFVMPVLSCDLVASPPWFTMPLAELTFAERIQTARSEGEIPWSDLEQILNALDELHRLGFVHRDLKPQNILRHNGKWKLSDFGLVRPPRAETTALTSTASAWGSEMYSAPEQVESFRLATPSADIYSFGCILHDIAVGTARIPYQQQQGDGPVGLLISKCTERQPRKRFKNIAALRSALLFVRVEAESLPPSPTAADWVRRLGLIDRWEVADVEGFTRFLASLTDERDEVALLEALDEDALKAISAVDQDLFSVVADFFCRASRRPFVFEYCDVVVGRLESVFDLGDLSTKAAASVAAAELGSSHNRFYVMRRVMQMCGPEMDSIVAERLAIEIAAEEAQGAFANCAEGIGRSVKEYHPRIADAIRH